MTISSLSPCLLTQYGVESWVIKNTCLVTSIVLPQLAMYVYGSQGCQHVPLDIYLCAWRPLQMGHLLCMFSMSLISCFHFVRGSVGISQGYLCTQGQWEGNNVVIGKRMTDSQTDRHRPPYASCKLCTKFMVHCERSCCIHFYKGLMIQFSILG